MKRKLLAQPFNTEANIEAAIHTQDAADTGTSHYRNVQGVARGDAIHRTDYFAPGPYLGHPESHDFIRNRIKAGESGIDGIRPTNSRVSMQNLVVHLDIGYETLLFFNQSLQ